MLLDADVDGAVEGVEYEILENWVSEDADMDVGKMGEPMRKRYPLYCSLLDDGECTEAEWAFTYSSNSGI